MKKLKIKKIISSLNEISHFNRYLILTIVFLFSYIFYLSIPSLYDYESLQKQLEIKLLEEFKLKITLSKNIKYITSPWPYFEIFDSTLYLETKDKVNELGKIKKLKIYISTRNLYKQEKLKINKILFQESIFNLNNNSWKFLSDYFQNKVSKKKIFVKKSKIFLKQNNDHGALAIFTIDNLDTFFNDKTNHNKLNIYGKGFNTSFDLKWTSDLNNLGKSKFLSLASGPIAEFVRGITGYSTGPLYLGIIIGLFAILFSFILIIYALYSKFAGIAIPGSSGVIITIAFFSGAILTTIGITGLYIARIYEQTQGRPRYIIKNIIEPKNNQ